MVNRLVTNLVVAVTAFLIGLASASALNNLASEKQSPAIQSSKVDVMGNVVSNQD